MNNHLLVLSLCILYALVFPITKILLNYAPPLFLTGLRMLCASLLLFIYLYNSNRAALKIHFADLWPIFMIGITGIYLTNALEAWGLQFMASGKASFIYSFTPIFTALLSYFYFSEIITAKKALGLILGIIGFLPVLMETASIEDPSGNIFFFSIAELAIFGAAMTTAIGWNVMRVMVKQHNLSAISMNLYSMIVGGSIALIHSTLSENWNPTPVHDWQAFLIWFIALMIISNIIAYNLHAFLLKTYTATYLSFSHLSVPFFAALFGYYLLGEVLSIYFWISITIVSIGLVIYYQEELKQGYIQHNKI